MIELEGAIHSVVPGHNGRLFLGTQDGFDIQLFTSGKPFNEGLLYVWKRVLQRRANELAKRGIPYVVYVVPDAHSIFTEDLPDALRNTYVPPGELFMAAMRDVRGVTLLYPRERLLAAKGGLELYRKNDTHWTEYGSFVAYGALCDALRPLVPLTEVPARDVQFTFRRSFGDLGSRVEPELVEHVPVAAIRHHESALTSYNDGVSRLNTIETHSPTAATCRALFFRDSFMTDQALYVTRSFSHVLMAGTTSRLYLDVVDDWKPDVVVSQVAERRLYTLQLDHDVEMFDDVFNTDYRSPRGKKLLQAMLQLRNGAPAAALPFIEGLTEAGDLAPDHAFAAAQICLAAGDLPQAEKFIARARAARPRQASYLCVAAKILAAMGRGAEAVHLVEQAVELAPYNGYYHELYAFFLIELGEYQRARTHLDAVLRDIIDSSSLWYWGSVAREALGDTAAATAAAEQAWRLYPSHAQYQEHLDRLRSPSSPHSEPAAKRAPPPQRSPSLAPSKEPAVKSSRLRIETTGAGTLRGVVSIAAESPRSVTVRCNSEHWATLPLTPTNEGAFEFLCDLPPGTARDRVAVEVVESSTQQLLGRLDVDEQTPLTNAYGLPAAEVWGLHHAPLFSVPWLQFDGEKLIVSGAHLPPEGDPGQLGVKLAAGVDYVFEYPLWFDGFGQHFWYWPNARWSAFKLTINLPASAPGADAFSFRFVYPGSEREAPERTTIWIPRQLDSFVCFPKDPSQLTRVQTFSDAQSVTFTGYCGFRMLEQLLRRHGLPGAGEVSILDWGCGHGRLSRHFIAGWPRARMTGIDIDAENVSWCQQHLRGGTFHVAPLWPPTALPAESFDALFGISVMTHLTADAQQAWLRELSRILKPNGLALLSFAGSTAVAYASIHHDREWWQRWLRNGFDDAQPDPALDGKISDDAYYRLTHQTEEHVRRTWGAHFDVLAVESEVFGFQDVAVLRRR